MKKLLVLIVLAFFTFLGNGYGGFKTLKGPEVTASTQNVPGEDSFITEIYHWDTTTASYKKQSTSKAHIALRVPVNAWAHGKGYLSLYSRGDLHRYSSAYHPEDESPAHVSGLTGDSKTRVKVGSGFGPLFMMGDGYKGLTATATGTLVTDTSNKYELKGKGKLDDHGGGDSGSVGPVSGGTSGTSGSGGWVNDSTSFRVSVLDVRPKPPDNTPNCQDCTSDCPSPCSCTNSGTCGGTVSTPPSGGGSTPPSENPVVSPTPTPTPAPPPSPTYHACGEHETSVSGDHSLQASCASTDSNGNYCTVTNFYACDSHTHSYPTPPPPPTATCANGHTYNPNSTYAKNYHRTRTCRYSDCGKSWEKFTTPRTPICDRPYRKRNGLRCWPLPQ